MPGRVQAGVWAAEEAGSEYGPEVLAARGAPVCRCVQYWAEVEVGASVYCVCLLCVYVCACACVYSVVCMCVYVCCV